MLLSLLHLTLPSTRPSQDRHYSHDPRRPPHTPHHNGRIRPCDIPCKSRLFQHLSQAIPDLFIQARQHAGNQDHRGRGQDVQNGQGQPFEDGRLGARVDEAQRSAEYAYEEGEGEVEGRERGKEHAEEEQRKGADEMVLLGCG